MDWRRAIGCSYDPLKTPASTGWTGKRRSNREQNYFMPINQLPTNPIIRQYIVGIHLHVALYSSSPVSALPCFLHQPLAAATIYYYSWLTMLFPEKRQHSRQQSPASPVPTFSMIKIGFFLNLLLLLLLLPVLLLLFWTTEDFGFGLLSLGSSMKIWYNLIENLFLESK